MVALIWKGVFLNLILPTTHDGDYSNAVGHSEPSLALSTFLLHHLPISKEDKEEEETSTTASDKTKLAAIAYLSVPLEDGSSCTVHATLVRSSLNTITAQLLPEMMIVNKCPWKMEVAELVAGEDERDEELWEGKVLVAEKRERITVLESSESTVCVWKKVGINSKHQS